MDVPLVPKPEVDNLWWELFPNGVWKYLQIYIKSLLIYTAKQSESGPKNGDHIPGI